MKVSTTVLPEVSVSEHPRQLGWFGTSALAMGGSNQSLFLIGALALGQGSAAVPLLIIGLLLSWTSAFGWTELVLMWPNRVGGIAATCAEAFRPYSPVLANLTGVCYWWGWVPTCGLTAILSATAIHEWYLGWVPIPAMAAALVLFFMTVNLCGLRWVTRLAIPIATVSGVLALLSAVIPIATGHVDWHHAATYNLLTPFHGVFGGITGALAGLYLVGFAAPAFEAATCHVGETVNPARNVPRAVFASGFMAFIYFAVLPVVWLGTLGIGPLEHPLTQTLGPTFAPLFDGTARAAAIWFMMFNMFHGTLQPLAGASRTLAQLSEDGLVPRILSLRNRVDAPWVATMLTAGVAIVFLLTGDPTWVIAAANLAYLIGIGMPNVAVWLLRRNSPGLERPYRAPRGTIVAGLVASAVWGIATIFGFEQFGLTTVMFGIAMAYSSTALYAWRRLSDRRRAGLPNLTLARSLHLKLSGAMLAVLVLDGIGYFLAVSSVRGADPALVAALEDIFVAVALLTVAVGLILPGMIGHAAGEVARAADSLAHGTLADLMSALQELSKGNLDAARVRTEISPVVVRSRDEVGDMAASFNTMQEEVARAGIALDGAREGVKAAHDQTRRALATAEDANGRLRSLIAASPLPIITLGEDGAVRGWNPAAQSTFGWTSEDVTGRPPDLLAADETGVAVLQRAVAGEMVHDAEIRARSKSGGSIDVSVSAAGMRDESGAVAGAVLVMADITKRKSTEVALEHQALHDALTGLPNRTLLRDRIRQAIREAQRENTDCSLLLMDLDRFKEINDTFGHQYGDLMLQEVGGRLHRALRTSDTVARLGGDEFAVILPGTGQAGAVMAANQLLEILERPFLVKGYSLNVSCSIGIAVFPAHGTDHAGLMQRADVAMYAAKRSGGGWSVYAPEQDQNSAARLARASDLRTALERDELVLHYQPKVSLADRRTSGVEALVRWNHPVYKMVLPVDFIPLAEQAGLMKPITLWVVGAALRQWRAWHEDGLDLRIAVNLSARSLHDTELVQTLADELAAWDVAPEWLEVEVTESAIMEHPERAVQIVKKLHDMGLKVSIDDFGTGYSSLAYLKQLPVDEIKIDRSFVAELATNENDVFIVRSVTDLGHNLGLDVVAEGVGDAATWDALRLMGCDTAQGFHIAEPMPGADMPAWVRRYHREMTA